MEKKDVLSEGDIVDDENDDKIWGFLKKKYIAITILYLKIFYNIFFFLLIIINNLYL